MAAHEGAPHLGKQQGISLLETLIAVAILAVIGVAFLTALQGGFLGTGKVDEFVTAESLARNQMEHIKSLSYQDGYEATVSCPPEYEATIGVKDVTPDLSNTLQRVTVTILRSGQVVLKLESYKYKPEAP